MTTHSHRCAFERIIACMFQFENKEMHLEYWEAFVIIVSGDILLMNI
jgi:hypothetical protein